MTRTLDHGLDSKTWDFRAPNHHTFVVTAIPQPEREGPNAPMLTALDSARMQFGVDFVSGDGNAFVVRAGTDTLYVENRRAFHELLRTAFSKGGLVEWFYFRVGHSTALLDMSDHPHPQPERLFPTEETAPSDEGAELAKYFLANEAPPQSLLLSYLRKRAPAPEDEPFAMQVAVTGEPIYDNRIELAARVYNRGTYVPKPLSEFYGTLGEILACSDWRDRLLRRTTLPGEEGVLNQVEQLSRAKDALWLCDDQRAAAVLLVTKLATELGFPVHVHHNAQWPGVKANPSRSLGSATVTIQLPSRTSTPLHVRWNFTIRTAALLHTTQRLFLAIQNKKTPDTPNASNPSVDPNETVLSFLNQETP